MIIILLESSRVVAIATLSGGAQADWKEFELQFEYKKNFDPQQNSVALITKYPFLNCKIEKRHKPLI